MSAVNITNVTVLGNPAPFVSPFQFEISYECLLPLKDGGLMSHEQVIVFSSNSNFLFKFKAVSGTDNDLEWKLVYVGSAEDETYDQLLESVLVGPVNVGNYRFVFEEVCIHQILSDPILQELLAPGYQYIYIYGKADSPDPSKIREEDIIGVTVLLLTCSYLGQEFIRVGYYVNNDYDDEQLREEPPQKVLVDKVQRNILADKPRVTKFPINFHPENEQGEQLTDVPDTVAEINENGEEPLPPSPTPPSDA